ncbi:MAG: hypothetical protein Q9M39_09215 [Sulfurovum sp.]|nr:hypothetical protein [Sulfurovum sp.]
MKVIILLMLSIVWTYAHEGTSTEYEILVYGQFFLNLLLFVYIVVEKFNLVKKWKQRRKGVLQHLVVAQILPWLLKLKPSLGMRFSRFLKDTSPPPLKAELYTKTTNADIVEQYRVEMRKVKIENQPFRISGLLHILTNKLKTILQKNKQTLYFDVQSDVGRYIVGDNDYIEQVLEILLTQSLELSTGSGISLKISKVKDQFIVFDIINKNGFMDKASVKEYMQANRTLSTMRQNLLTFIKAKKIAEAMSGIHRSKKQ